MDRPPEIDYPRKPIPWQSYMSNHAALPSAQASQSYRWYSLSERSTRVLTVRGSAP